MGLESEYDRVADEVSLYWRGAFCMIVCYVSRIYKTEQVADRVVAALVAEDYFRVAMQVLKNESSLSSSSLPPS